ncbi:MAG: ABC transporter permease [Lachnospiraceae bacterium]|nr:ABC transporter permease [Lachnospiraceae bacterium]
MAAKLRKKHKLRRWMLVLLILSAVSLVLFLVFWRWHYAVSHSFPDELAADRWGDAADTSQIDVFFSVDAPITPDSFLYAEHMLETELENAGITPPEDSNADLYKSAYCATGKVYLNNKTNNIEVKALGVSGDYFYFHPVDLISGSVFSPEDINDDYVLLDQTSAWQLFGGTDIAGQILECGGRTLIIRGVYRQREDKLAKAAGLDTPLVFVGYDTLVNTGVSYGINSYEIVMPNPIRDFALTNVKKQLGMDDVYAQFVDVTGRFGILPGIQTLKNFTVRCMNSKAIIYPYWENVSRALENRCALLLIPTGLFLLLAVLFFLIPLLYTWNHKGWKLQEQIPVWIGRIRDRIYTARVNRAQKKLHVSSSDHAADETSHSNKSKGRGRRRGSSKEEEV